MTKRYKPYKSRSFGVFLLVSWLVVLLILPGAILLNGTFERSQIIASIAIIVPFTLLLASMWISTGYKVVNDIFIANWGPFKWHVPINEIKSIRKNQKTISGIWKPTLSWNCIEIRYRKYKSISVTPLEEAEFINHLKSINPEIVIYEI